MITLQQLIGNNKLDDIPKEHIDNMNDLLVKVNKILNKYNKNVIPTSGYRSKKQHLAIYAKKGITDESKIPMKSKHLFGYAVDISDPNKELQKWCKENEAFLVEVGIWLEAFEDTPNWVHFQSIPYKSWVTGKSIWFKPF